MINARSLFKRLKSILLVIFIRLDCEFKFFNKLIDHFFQYKINCAISAPVSMVPVMCWARKSQSSVSTKTVPSLAA